MIHKCRFCRTALRTLCLAAAMSTQRQVWQDGLLPSLTPAHSHAGRGRGGGAVPGDGAGDGGPGAQQRGVPGAAAGPARRLRHLGPQLHHPRAGHVHGGLLRVLGRRFCRVFCCRAKRRANVGLPSELASCESSRPWHLPLWDLLLSSCQSEPSVHALDQIFLPS